MPQHQIAKPEIVMLLYDGMALLDLVGPLTVFRMMGADVRMVARHQGPVNCDVGLVFPETQGFHAAFATPDVLCVPGGLEGTLAAMQDLATVDFVRASGERARFVTSVCTGSLLLGVAGLLQGYKATSHWYVRDLLPLLGAVPQESRVVQDRNRITAGGVTAGLDFGLTLAAVLQGEHVAKLIQLTLEYDPQPPFAAGTPAQAGPQLSGEVLAWRATALAEAKRVAGLAGRKLGGRPPAPAAQVLTLPAAGSA